MSFALDSSVALAWIYVDEFTPATTELLRRAATESTFVPTIWAAEVGNSLQMNVRRRRIDAAYRDRSLLDLAQLKINVDSETNDHIWSTSLALSETFKLTLYDACYLELAQRRNLPLATLDRDLRRAATAAGIEVLGL